MLYKILEEETLIQAFKSQDLNMKRRKLQSLKFRLRRRAKRFNENGDPFFKRDGVKNSNRQVAAKNRKRDENGKFLDGIRMVKKPEGQCVHLN